MLARRECAGFVRVLTDNHARSQQFCVHTVVYFSVAYAIRQLLAKNHKELPHDPGGRKKAVADDDRHLVIKEIAGLIEDGMEPRAAKEVVARKRAVSVSTIQRIWKQRGVLKR